MSDAIEQLRIREGRTPRNNIGHVNLTDMSTNLYQSPFHKLIAVWGHVHNLDAVIWTALQPNFIAKTGLSYSVDNALAYIGKLSGITSEVAFEYIKKAPTGVQTPFRKRFNDYLRGES